jgi:hypothetical protein
MGGSLFPYMGTPNHTLQITDLCLHLQGLLQLYV